MKSMDGGPKLGVSDQEQSAIVLGVDQGHCWALFPFVGVQLVDGWEVMRFLVALIPNDWQRIEVFQDQTQGLQVSFQQLEGGHVLQVFIQVLR